MFTKAVLHRYSLVTRDRFHNIGVSQAFSKYRSLDPLSVEIKFPAWQNWGSPWTIGGQDHNIRKSRKLVCFDKSYFHLLNLKILEKFSYVTVTTGDWDTLLQLAAEPGRHGGWAGWVPLAELWPIASEWLAELIEFKLAFSHCFQIRTHRGIDFVEENSNSGSWSREHRNLYWHCYSSKQHVTLYGLLIFDCQHCLVGRATNFQP